jgi:hypothetical protein
VLLGYIFSLILIALVLFSNSIGRNGFEVMGRASIKLCHHKVEYGRSDDTIL